MAQSDITPGNNNLYIITYTDEGKDTFRSATLARSNGVGKPTSTISLDVGTNRFNEYTDRALYNIAMSELKQPTIDYDPFVLLPPNCTTVDDNGDCVN